MNTIEEGWGKYYQKIANGKAKKVIANAMNPHLYPSQATLIRKEFPTLDKMYVLEIGCGFGGLCREVLKQGETKGYSVVDNSEMLKLAKKTLNGVDVNFIDAKEIQDVGNFDLLISNLCISETPREYQDYVLANVLPKCKNVFMLDGDRKTDYPARLEASIRKNFKSVTISKYDGDWRVKKYVGKN